MFKALTLSDISTIVEIGSKLLEGIAIIFGGYWTYKLFIQYREKYPRAKISHKIIQKPVERGKKLIRLSVQIENKSKVLMKIVKGEARVLQVLPLIGEIAKNVSNNVDPVKEKDTEILWYQIGNRLVDAIYEIEPGEDEQIHFDFIIEKDVETIQIYSFFENETKKRKDPLGWYCITFHDILKDPKGEKNAHISGNSSNRKKGRQTSRAKPAAKRKSSKAHS